MHTYICATFGCNCHSARNFSDIDHANGHHSDRSQPGCISSASRPLDGLVAGKLSRESPFQQRLEAKGQGLDLQAGISLGHEISS